MEIIRTIKEITKKCSEVKREGKKIGIVPTMGYLHQGHISLIKKAKEMSDFVVTTLFVNPTQFAPNEDFEKYPRDEKRDTKICEESGSNVLFIPDVKEMYPSGKYKTFVAVENLSEKLCGKSRPGHFRGVTTICLKLFNLTRADIGVFGWKDAQQLLILKRMVEDLNVPIELVGMPTVRENDGLAVSSRNVYLNQEQRNQATILFKALTSAAETLEKFPQTPSSEIVSGIKKMIESAPLARIDYVKMVDQENLEPIQKMIPQKTLIALAVFLGSTRLIDNIHI